MEQAQPDPDRRCKHCGTALTDETTGGLCPRCLLEMNFASRTMPGGEPSPQTPAPTPEEMAARFPQFEILECLGRGGMGIVYKARQKTLDRLVAIKVLVGERHDDPQFEARFSREARTLAKLSHPNIVTVHDFGESDGMFYLVMEFVDGVNLRDVLRDGRMEPAQALAIVPEICAALQFAHDHGVVHRDIKPENILIDRDGRVKIADFGIAALIGADADRAGTPPYMAPEQQAAGGTIDHRADIYALGVVFYEMLTGERPEQDPSKPSHRVEIDVRLDEIVLRALEKEPARRYQTAGEFRTVVETMAITPPVAGGRQRSVVDMASGVGSRASSNDAGTPPPLKTEGSQGPFSRFWWLFLVMPPLCLLLGFIAGGFWFVLAPKQYVARTMIEIRQQATGPDVAGVTALSPGDPEWITRLNAVPVLDHVASQLDLARSWSVDETQTRQSLVSFATFPAIPGTNLRELRIRHTDAEQAAMIANAWAQALKTWCSERNTGEVIMVVDEAITPERPFSPRFHDVIFLYGPIGLLISPLLTVLLIQVLHLGCRWLLRVIAVTTGVIVVTVLIVYGYISIARYLAFSNASQVVGIESTPPVAMPATPEQTARSFMEAMRDGKIDAAMAWMDSSTDTWFAPDFQPEKKTGDRLRDSLQHLSDEMTEEAYAGELDRLIQFTEWVPENRDETTHFLAVGIAAPSRWHEGGPDHALYLILSPTPDGWRVAHVGVADDDKSLAESKEQYWAIRAGGLPVTPPRTSQNGSSGSPEHVARSFMEAIRDGDMDAAVAWMDPKLKAREEYSPHLELASKILRDEIYTGQLERLTRFAESEFTNMDGSNKLFAARVTPPAGDEAQEGMGGPVLILSSTPDGWRVVHFGEGWAGKSLSEHMKEFQQMNPATVAAGLAKPEAATANAIIGKWQTADEKIQIEFFPDGTMRIEDGSTTIGGKYSFLDDGRVKTEMLAYGTSVIETIHVAVNGDVMTTIDERGKKQEMTRVRNDNPSADPAETGNITPDIQSTPEAQSPPKGAEISLDNQPQAVFHNVIKEFLAECKTAEIDTLAKMEKQLGLNVLRVREQDGENPEKMNRNLWHPVLREIIERPHEWHPYEAIRQTYVAKPSPYRQEAILLLKVMGDESPETEAFRHIIGPLGLPLGEFMIIEGRPCAVGKGGVVDFQSLEEISKFGVHGLEVQKVDGTALKAPAVIQITGNAKFTPAAYYVVRGYQTAELGSGNPASEDTNATVPQTDHQLQFRFLATAVMATTPASASDVVTSFIQEVGAHTANYTELAGFPEYVKQMEVKSKVEFYNNFKPIKPIAEPPDKNTAPVPTKWRTSPSDLGIVLSQAKGELFEKPVTITWQVEMDRAQGQ